MDIKKLKEDNLVVIQGFIHAEWVRKDAEITGANRLNPGNYTPGHKGNTQKRMFGIAFNQPVGNEFLVTTIIFDMSSCYGFRWMRPAKQEKPWENRRKVNPKTAQEVSNEELEQIKNDPTLKEMVEQWAEDKAPDALRKLSKLSFASNNGLVADQRRKDEHDAFIKRIRDYALSLDPEDNYWWESEWTHTNYDPYNGSGDCTLATIALADKCKDEKEVDELLANLNNGGVVHVNGDKTHTWYWKKKSAIKESKMKKFLVKNYKGNITESLKKFNKLNPSLKIKAVKESAKGLIIETVADEDEDKFDSYRADFDGMVDRFNKAIHNGDSSAELLKIAKEMATVLEKMSKLDK